MGLGSGMAIADRFAAYVGELTKVIGPCGPGGTAAELLLWAAGDGGSAQR
jgi:hypothetical protein